RVVDHGARPTAAHPDEDALVEPVELLGRGLDRGRGAEGVLARVDVLASGESLEHLGAAVAYAPRLHVEQRAAVGLQRVADVAEGGAVRQDDLPVRARPREELSVQLRTPERALRQWQDPPPPDAKVADIDHVSERGFEAVDPRQPGLGQLGHRTSRPGSLT